MQNKHQFFFLVLGVPTLGEGSTWLGQIPKFFQKFDLKASLMMMMMRRRKMVILMMLLNGIDCAGEDKVDDEDS